MKTFDSTSKTVQCLMLPRDLNIKAIREWIKREDYRKILGMPWLVINIVSNFGSPFFLIEIFQEYRTKNCFQEDKFKQYLGKYLQDKTSGILDSMISLSITTITLKDLEFRSKYNIGQIYATTIQPYIDEFCKDKEYNIQYFQHRKEFQYSTKKL